MSVILNLILSTVMFILWQQFGHSETNGPVCEGEKESTKNTTTKHELFGQNFGNCYVCYSYSLINSGVCIVAVVWNRRAPKIQQQNMNYLAKILETVMSVILILSSTVVFVLW